MRAVVMLEVCSIVDSDKNPCGMKFTTCAKLENAVQIAVYLEKTMLNSIIDRLLGTILSYLSSHAFRVAIISFVFI